MHSKHIKISKLFYEDEFSKILRSYNNRDISGSKFCEIINDKADKLISFNDELLEILRAMVEVFEPLANENNIRIDNVKEILKKSTK